jgi:riboflavin biosynthesis pyrimidine reductase
MGASFASEFKSAHPEELGEDGVIRVCVGGGAGFIGSHIAKKLKEEVLHLQYLPAYLT